MAYTVPCPPAVSVLDPPVLLPVENEMEGAFAAEPSTLTAPQTELHTAPHGHARRDVTRALTARGERDFGFGADENVRRWAVRGIKGSERRPK